MAEPKVLKVSVLASGALLLDGQPVTLAALESAIDQGAKNGAVIWYYREKAEEDPPPLAMDVLKAVTRNKLPIRMSSKPDFSDTITPALPDLEKTFASIRQRAAQRQLLILRPDGKVMTLPALDKKAVPAAALTAVERLLPSKISRNVAVIADTAWAAGKSAGIQSANEAIPFFGMLVGFASLGHAVWIFDPKEAITLLAAGCREADVVIVDSSRMATLPQDWAPAAGKAMRKPQVLVFDRANQQLRRA